MAIRLAVGALLVLLLLLQYRLWFGEASVFDIVENRRRIAELELQAEELRTRNEALRAEVNDLKNGMEAIEERARRDLGMVRKGETFFQIIEPSAIESTDGAK